MRTVLEGRCHRIRGPRHYQSVTPFSDPSGFAAAYRAHSRAILVFLTRRTFDPETALDLTAETFAQAYASRRRFRGRTDEELRAWLFGIARHVLARFVRRGVVERRALARLGIEVPPMEEDDLARVTELAGLADLRATVLRSYDDLHPDQRDAVRLRIVDELPYDDVAARLAISEATARARVSRGLRALATAVDPHQTRMEALA